MGRYDKKNKRNRIGRDNRHNKRVMQENSKTITRLQFIENMDSYFFSGSRETPHNEFIIHFSLKYPVLVDDFIELLENKLRGAIIE